MSGVTLVVLVLFLCFLGIALVMLMAKRAVEDGDTQADSDLEAWVCPECGFNVQMGDVCIYCYTKKRRTSPESK